MSGKGIRRVLLVLAVAALVAAWFALGLNEKFSLAELKASRDQLAAYAQAHPVLCLGGYFLTYLLIAALALPAAAVATLAGGAVFGFWAGLVTVSFASTLGALCSFLIARFLLRDWVRKRFERVMGRVDRGVEREGAFYLFTLRLIPVFPFVAVNLVMGLTRMRPLTFALVSQVGMLPGTALYVNAGRQLGQVESVGDILSWQVFLSLALLGIFPLAVKKLLALVRRRPEVGGEP